MIDRGRHNVLGIRVNAVDYDLAVDQIIQAAKSRSPFGISALAVHGIMTGVMDEQHRHRLNQLEMIVPDGQPVRWGLNLLHGTRLGERVYGPNLMLRTCQAAADQQIPIFLFGSTASVLTDLETNLVQQFPGLIIAGKRPSQFRCMTAVEKTGVINEIRNSGAGITMVGLGCPRQEVWAYEYREALAMPVLAIGAAFDFHSGNLAQAPAFMQKRGLEWLYRLAQEPRRLWKRYCILNPWYLWLLMLQKSGLREFDLDNTKPPTREILYG